MCGIYFTFSKEDNTPDAINLAGISHRGPDEQIVKCISGSKAQIGFCRLAIRDLNGGMQPFFHEEFASAINGELYNQEEISNRIREIAPNVTLPSGDMQILALYIHVTSGAEMSLVKGMFAGFIFFNDENKIMFFRDPVGEKPLFCSISESKFQLCSELRFNQVSGAKSPPIVVSHSDVIRGNFEVNAEDSIFECKPATVYEFDFKSWEMTSRTYFEWPTRSLLGRRMSNDFLEQELIDAVDSQLVSDVPIALMLSGGIDSSLLAFLITIVLGKKVKAFTLGFEEKSWDESLLAARFADELKLEHEVIRVSSEQMADEIPNVVHAMDVPILDTACISMFMLAKGIALTHKVAISGDGGDEISQGYELFRWINLIRILRRLGPAAAVTLQKLAQASGAASSYNSRGMKLARLSDVLAYSEYPIEEIALSPFAGTELMRVLGSDSIEEIRPFRKSNRETLERYYSQKILPTVYLAKSDRMSMTHSLEVRSPFLDREVIAKAFTVGKASLTLHKRKHVLYSLAKKYLPDYILEKPKHGFSAPMTAVIRLLNEPRWDPRLTEIFGQKSVKDVWSLGGRSQNHAMASWSLYVLNSFFSADKLRCLCCSQPEPVNSL